MSAPTTNRLSISSTTRPWRASRRRPSSCTFACPARRTTRPTLRESKSQMNLIKKIAQSFPTLGQIGEDLVCVLDAVRIFYGLFYVFFSGRRAHLHCLWRGRWCQYHLQICGKICYFNFQFLSWPGQTASWASFFCTALPRQVFNIFFKFANFNF